MSTEESPIAKGDPRYPRYIQMHDQWQGLETSLSQARNLKQKVAILTAQRSMSL